MLRNYLKLTLRNIYRNKIHSLINIIGISLGLTCFILIYLWIRHETSFDKFHKNSQHIYRLLKADDETTCGHPNLLHTSLEEGIPEIIGSTKINSYDSPLFEINENNFITGDILFVDPDFFRIFDFPIIIGKPSESLKEPFSIFLTQSAALKYFGTENIIGQTVEYDNKHIFTVKGIIKDFPENSHIQGEFVASYESLRSITDYWFKNWYVRMANIYLFLPENIDIPALEQRIKTHINQSKPDYYDTYNYILEPLEKIHLYSADTRGGIGEKGNIEYVILFVLIIILIILIAAFNYTNLTISHFAKSFKNIGIKKTIGAKSRQIAEEVFFYTFSICFISLWIASITVEGILPIFNNLTNKKLIFDPLFNLQLISILALVLSLLTLLSGFYPAIFLSRQKAINSIQSLNNSKSNKSIYSRISNILICFQFGVSVILISFSIIISKQLNLLTEEKLGFDKKNLAILDNPWDKNFNKRFNYLIDKSLNSTSILGISRTRNSPGESPENYTAVYTDSNAENGFNCARIHVEANYLNVIGANFIEGRDLSKDIQSDSAAIVINESLAKTLNFENPIGKSLYTYFLTGKPAPLKIIGIIEDMQHAPLKYSNSPAIYYFYISNKPDIIVRFKENKVEEGISYLEEYWKEIENDWPFQWQLLSDKIEASYRSEFNTKKVLNVLCAIALFLSCIGTFGLVGFYVDKKAKEIAIRKIHGSSIQIIIMLLSKRYLYNILITSCVAVPAIIYFGKKWLQNFIFQIEIEWWYIIISILIVMLITLITISNYVIKAARKNPVESLRYE